MKTKDAILDRARQLFNDRGTPSVSTNHVAAALSISAGNLYYHYRNKEQIIRANYARFVERTDEAWRASEGPSDAEPWADFRNRLTHHFRVVEEFAFFSRELAVLVLTDPELRDQVDAARSRMEQHLQQALHRLQSSGAIQRQPSRAAFELLLGLLVMWPAQAEVLGSDRTGVDVVLELLASLR